MLTNADNLNCEYRHEMIAYIYGESGEAARLGFEEHLLGCTACTDEFACIADTRFSVFEWHKEEFAPLPTPPIVIPYVAAAQLSARPSNGFLAGLRHILTIPQVATAFAAVLVTVVVGFFGFNYMSDREIAVAGPEPDIRQPAARVSTATLKEVSPVATVATDEPDVDVSTRRERGETKTRRGTRTTLQTHVVGKPLMANVKRSAERDPRPNSAQVRKAPVLNNFEESDDRSLRLSDLFDDGGAGR
jgi:anti-sigma factor RsiW